MSLCNPGRLEDYHDILHVQVTFSLPVFLKNLWTIHVVPFWATSFLILVQSSDSREKGLMDYACIQDLQVLIFVTYLMLKYIFHPPISHTGLCLWIEVGLETMQMGQGTHWTSQQSITMLTTEMTVVTTANPCCTHFSTFSIHLACTRDLGWSHLPESHLSYIITLLLKSILPFVLQVNVKYNHHLS